MRRQELLFRPIACSNSFHATATAAAAAAAVKRHIWTSSSIQGWLCSLSLNLDQFELQETGVQDLDLPSNCTTFNVRMYCIYVYCMGSPLRFLIYWVAGQTKEDLKVAESDFSPRAAASQGPDVGVQSLRGPLRSYLPPLSPCQNHQSSLTAIRPTAKPTSTQPT